MAENFEKWIQFFSGSADRIVDDLATRLPLPRCLYHYTRPAGLIGILQSGRIYASNAKNMNDASELRYATDVIADTVRADTSTLAREPSDFLINFFSVLVAMPRTVEIYVASFSADGDLLNQWRSYCDHGRGYSIGFDAGVLQRTTAGALVRVEYDRSRQRQAIYDLLHLVRESLIDAFRRRDRQMIAAIEEAVKPAFTKFLMMIKHPSFAEEQEFRIVRPVDDASCQILFRPTSSGVIPFIEVSLSSEASSPNLLPLSEITLGPCLEHVRQERSVSILLRHLGYSDVSILPSRVPLT